MGGVGGDPATIGAAASSLLSTAGVISDRPAGISKAASDGSTGCGDARLAAALARFGAAYGQFTGDLGIEIKALGTLAQNTGADLATAGGEH